MQWKRLLQLLTLLASAMACSQIQSGSISLDWQPNRGPPPPALISDWDGNLRPLELRNVEVDVRVFGPLAETQMTLTFFNLYSDDLEGDLYFPLPEGATISGYALDVEGQLVEGVVVDKYEARRVLELEARRGVDPGLVEWVKGNSFRTRVFPVRAGGSRTIRVSYVSDLIDSDGDPIYHLPLGFRDRIDQISLRIEVIQGAALPEVIDNAGLANFVFSSWKKSYVAEQKLSNAKLTGDLSIALPDLHTQQVWVEWAPDGRVYFLIRDPIASSLNTPLSAAAKRIRLLWDTSGSRSSADLKREIDVLERLLASPIAQNAEIELIRFADRAEPGVRFILPGQLAQLTRALGSVRYDGGTQRSAMSTPAQTAQPDFYLLFGDGIHSYGETALERIEAPVYAINSSSTADHAFLRHLTRTTGGAYFNLNEISDARVVAEINHEGLQFKSASADDGAVSETVPSIPERIHGAFTLAGVLLAEVATVALEYGSSDRVDERRRYAIRRESASEGNVIARYWAALKIDELLAAPEENRPEIRELGRRHSIVTPGTSLIVLETLDQYVEHRIRPPASLPSLRAEYDAEIDDLSKEEQIAKRSKLDRILELWRGRVAWWETEFQYPKDFDYAEFKKQLKARAANSHRSITERNRPSAATFGDEFGAQEIEEIIIMGESAGSLDDAPVSVTAFSSGDLSAIRIEDIADLSNYTPNLEIDSADSPPSSVSIALEAWEPDAPYFAALEAAAPEQRIDVYFALKASHGRSPGFFLDCADFFHRNGDDLWSAKVLSNLAELELENAALLRILAHRLAQRDQLDMSIVLFEAVLSLRPEEPQSSRDLALVLARRADGRSGEAARADYERALELLGDVVMTEWDRFDEIELIALVELNHILTRARRVGVEHAPVDERLVRPIDLDVRIVMTWDTDMTDMDLHVIEPSGEEAFFDHNRTVIGGLVTRDFTSGYGPEVYMVRRAMPGAYRIEADYFGSNSTRLVGAITLQVDVFTHWGRPDEKLESLTFRLAEEKDRFNIGEIEF